MTDSKDFFCSDLARDYEIPLVGTATRGDIWFLLEYSGAWGAKAFEESDIPQNVKNFLSDFRVDDKRIRILLIRQDRLKTHPGIHLFVGQTFPTEPRLYEYQLDDYADIQKLDFSWLSTGEEGSLKHLREEPLFLVCSNGRRDKCCARYGPAIYQELVEEAGDSVWQSSHIGGHNQTPIMLFFPHGVNYARTTPAEARSLVREYQHGRLVLNHYRGRVGIEPHVQAAEHFWRKSTGVLDLPGMRVESFSQVSEDQWDVKIVGTIGDSSKPIQVERRKTDFSIPITCSKKKQSLIVSYHQVNNK